MARINVEDSIFKDGRFFKLSMRLGSQERALGSLVMAWVLAQKWWLKSAHRTIPIDDWKRSLTVVDEILECGFAEITDTGVYVSGSREQFGWLEQRSQAGRKNIREKSERSLTGLQRNLTEPNGSNPLTLTLPLSPSLPLSLNSSSISENSSQNVNVSGPVDLVLFEQRESVSRSRKPNPLNVAVWDSYQEAYKGRYGEPPIRNAAVNAKIAQLVKRLGEEAPEVARFYVSHNKQFYVQNLHPVGMLLSDAESLRTQWALGKQVLSTTGREVERMQHNSDVWQGAASRIAARKADQNG